MGDIGLVREAHAERHALARVVAPHLVRPRAFLVPVYRGGPVRAAKLRAGLVLYGGLGRFADGGGSLLRPRAAQALVPPLRTAGLRSAGRYVDDETNDARLTVAVARAAARAGAAIATRVEVRALRLTGGPRRRRRVHGRPRRRGSCPWTRPAWSTPPGPGSTSCGAWPIRRRRARCGFAKGAHLIVRLDEPWGAALTTPLERRARAVREPLGGRAARRHDGRAVRGRSAGRSRRPRRDVEQIVRESRASIEPGVVEHDRILSSFAGVRVLPQGDGETPSARRETVFERGRDGMLSIAGGKFTTFRRIALDALERVRGDLGLRALDRAPAPLPGAADPEAVVERLLRDHPGAARVQRPSSRALPRQRRARAARQERATIPRCSSRSSRARRRSRRRCAGRASGSGR